MDNKITKCKDNKQIPSGKSGVTLEGRPKRVVVDGQMTHWFYLCNYCGKRFIDIKRIIKTGHYEN